MIHIFIIYPGLNDAVTIQVEVWVDTTDNEGLDETRSIPNTKTEVDQHMICDIQQTTSRLVGKAPQLIGKKESINKQ